MTAYFVTRHAGARDWAAEEGFGATELVTHFDPAVVAAGDVVIGTLPIHLAAAVCAAGGRYLHLTLDLPDAARGKELTADDMRAYGARVEEFRVTRA